MGEVKYDVRAAFEKIPEIVGMELHRKGEQWQGGYYLNGEPHPWRRDKLKFYKLKGSIWVTEEGGRTISMTTWLQEFGGASDFWDAVRILKGVKTPIIMDKEFIERNGKAEIKYVDAGVLEAARMWDLDKCPLFRWMCVFFPKERVEKVWRMYNVTTNAKGDAVFWNVDAQGRICHDKVMKYLNNGHRDKSYGGGRTYTTAKGYGGRCLFGAHLIGNRRPVRVVESEKTALLAACYTGKLFVATGGKNGLGRVERGMVLYPDIDAIEEWSAKTGAVVERWWEGWSITDDHADYGDYIVDVIRKEGKSL